MIDEPLARGVSRIHALDPRYKLVACLALSLVAALAAGAQAPTVVLVLGVTLTVMANPPFGLVWRRLLAVNAFVAFLWLVVPFTAPGTPIWQWRGFTATREGLFLVGVITLKTNAIFFCIAALVATIPVPSLGRALTALRVPAKFSFLFIFTYRYVHVIAEEYERLATAARLRGFIPGTNWRTYRTYAALLAMVLVHSFDRSQRVYHAMVLRGFAGTFPSLDRFNPKRSDTVFLALSLLVAVAAGVLEYWARRGHV